MTEVDGVGIPMEGIINNHDNLEMNINCLPEVRNEKISFKILNKDLLPKKNQFVNNNHNATPKIENHQLGSDMEVDLKDKEIKYLNGNAQTPIEKLVQDAEAHYYDKIRQKKIDSKIKAFGPKNCLKRRFLEYKSSMRDPNKDSNIIQGFYAVDKQSFSDLKPSLILHLYQHNFAFENVPGSFPYDAMMESFLSAIDSNYIPAEISDLFDDSQCQYYEGCLVVEVRNHRNINPPEIRKLLLRPSFETIVTDLQQLLHSQNFQVTDERCFEVEKKLIHATSNPLCLDPSVNVALVANVINYNRHKFSRFTKRRRIQRLIKDETDSEDSIKKFELLNFLEQKKVENADSVPEYMWKSSFDKSGNKQVYRKQSVPNDFACHRGFPVSPYPNTSNFPVPPTERRSKIRTIRFERKTKEKDFIVIEVTKAISNTQYFEVLLKVGKSFDNVTNTEISKFQFNEEKILQSHLENIRCQLAWESYECLSDTSKEFERKPVPNPQMNPNPNQIPNPNQNPNQIPNPNPNQIQNPNQIPNPAPTPNQIPNQNLNRSPSMNPNSNINHNPTPNLNPNVNQNVNQNQPNIPPQNMQNQLAKKQSIPPNMANKNMVPIQAGQQRMNPNAIPQNMNPNTINHPQNVNNVNLNPNVNPNLMKQRISTPQTKGAYINPNPTNQPIMNPPQSNNPIQNPPVQGTPPMQMGMQNKKVVQRKVSVGRPIPPQNQTPIPNHNQYPNQVPNQPQAQNRMMVNQNQPQNPNPMNNFPQRPVQNPQAFQQRNPMIQNPSPNPNVHQNS